MSPEEAEAVAAAFMAAVEAGRMIDRRPASLEPAGPPTRWDGELEAARACWRKHRDQVRWQFGRWRPCADCLDDLRTSQRAAGGSPA